MRLQSSCWAGAEGSTVGRVFAFKLIYVVIGRPWFLAAWASALGCLLT